MEFLADDELQHSLKLVSVSVEPPPSDPWATRPQDDGDASAVSQQSGSSGKRFRIIRPHARGGLGEVFVAQDDELGRLVALKEILARHSHNQHSRTRFLLEGEITGKLEHPGIVPVYGLGMYEDGRPFYAMRFIDGDTLHTAIREFHGQRSESEGSLEHDVAFRKLLGRFVDICQAIGYAHSRGVLHRDLKPGNVMVGKHGETLVVDWGLAKLCGIHEPPDTNENYMTVKSASGTNPTLPGSAIGTPGYMSPEQARGQTDQLGPATDIYSLGAILYSLLTGNPPLKETNFAEFVRRDGSGGIPRPLAAGKRHLVHQQQDRTENIVIVDGVNRQLSTLSADGQDGVVIGEDINGLGYARVDDITQRQPQGLVHHPDIKTAFLLADGRHLLTTSYDRGKFWDLARSVLPEVRLESFGLAYWRGAFRSDGLQVATLGDRFEQGVDTYYLTLWDATTGIQQKQIQLPQVAKLLEYSPNGRRIVTAEGPKSLVSLSGLGQLWDPETGDAAGPPLRHDKAITSVSFHPQSQYVVTTSRDNTARIWNAVTGEPHSEPLTHSAEPRSEVLDADFSPDGRLLVTAAGNFSGFGEVRIWNVASGEATLWQSKRFAARVPQVRFHPSGKSIAFAEGQRVRMIDVTSGDELLVIDTGPLQRFDWDPSGDRLLLQTDILQIRDAHSGELLTRSVRHLGNVNHTEFSPDGRWLLLCGYFTKNRNQPGGTIYKTWLVDAQTAEPLIQLGRYGGTIYHSTFSPDSRRLLVTPMTQAAEIYRIPESSFAADNDDFEDYSSLAAGYRVDDVGGFYPSENTAQQEFNTYQQLKQEYPDVFRSTKQETSNWHKTQYFNRLVAETLQRRNNTSRR